ncbi:MAG: malto-oligosyltrehalose trehalohydrolase [Actinomycetota bacterium]|nr:malto-oligosyltrehalose trehalohydrolase [Actinomycetota bacterium]
MTAEFRVWAPKPDRVELVVDDRRVAMEPATGGWWVTAVDDAGPGARYGFSLDGGPPRPDPRSASQPDGVHGLSEVVDHTAFAWHDHRWRGLPLAGSVLYELHVGTFTPKGTFDAAIERLGHLVDLGVDAVELLPVAEFSGRRGWGYDGVDLFAPHSAYGGPAGLKRLVDACHDAGIGVVMDVVYNHLGPSGNYLPEFGPYFSERHHTNWGPAVNFDGPDSGEVRRFVVDNARMWLGDYHCDGLRLDAVHAIIDESAVHILEEVGAEVAALGAHVHRPLFVIAESDLNNPVFVRSGDAGGHGLDAAWADEWHHALHAAFAGETNGYYEDFGSLDLLAKALQQAWVYDGIWSPHRRRVHGRPPAGLSGRHFVVCTQNHDQVGNRAVGERTGALMSEGRLRVAAALLLTAPFVPMLFQGEEWGASTPFQYFTDHEDPELGRAVSVGRRNEFAYFGWRAEDVPDPQEPSTFERSKLDWSELSDPNHAGLLDWYRRLIALRRSVPDLTDDRLDRVQVGYEATGRLVVRRGSVTVVVNVGDEPSTVPTAPSDSLLAASDAGVTGTEGRITLPPDTVAIIQGTA